MVDDYSRYTWIFLLKQKSEVVKVLEHFVIFVQTQFETTIKIIRSDNGTEFVVTHFFVSKGIIHQTSCVNIVVKRSSGIANKNRACEQTLKSNAYKSNA